MNKTYTAPCFELITLGSEDIITSSITNKEINVGGEEIKLPTIG